LTTSFTTKNASLIPLYFVGKFNTTTYFTLCSPILYVIVRSSHRFSRWLLVVLGWSRRLLSFAHLLLLFILLQFQFGDHLLSPI